MKLSSAPAKTNICDRTFTAQLHVGYRQRALLRFFNLKHQVAAHQQSGGFTLLEVLAVAIILGILGALVAPSWLGFLNRQRAVTARRELRLALRDAQQRARSTNAPVTVEFRNQNQLPQVGINGTWRNLGNGDIEPGQLQLSTPVATSIVFDYKGRVEPGQALPFRVLATTNANSTPHCVVIDYLLGSAREAEGTDCQ